MITINARRHVFNADSKHDAAYALGLHKPNYPVPATMFHAAIANYHNPAWSWQWAVQWTKARLHK